MTSARLRPSSRRRQRGGAIIMFMAIAMVFIVGLCGFAVDLGYIATARTQLQNAVDASTLAGAGMMSYDPSAVEDTVRQYLRDNFVVGTAPIPPEAIHVELGAWDKTNHTFDTSVTPPQALRVFVEHHNQRLFFGAVLGTTLFNTEARAIATFKPREMMFVLDYSGSMSYDSQVRAFDTIGQPEVEANLWDIYQELGAPTFGSMQWDPVLLTGSDNDIKEALGLDSEPYPFPSGSWNGFIDHVQGNGHIDNAGYEDRYGYLTLVNYWLDDEEQFADTPVLWQTSQQPLTAVKDGVSEFRAYLDQAEHTDRVGLAIYSHPDAEGAVLESGLSHDLALIDSIVRQRQAGHYVGYTNIGAGLQQARLELEANSRPETNKLIVLMTDGLANRPSGTAVEFVVEQANAAADAGIPVATISLGAGADTDLMQQVADITGGVHFNIPGGQSVDEYTEELRDLFRQIAADRDLELVE